MGDGMSMTGRRDEPCYRLLVLGASNGWSDASPVQDVGFLQRLVPGGSTVARVRMRNI
jgi:hypothetical protein